MRIVWQTPELGPFSSGIVNHTNIYVDYLRKCPDVKEVIVVKYPVPENGVLPPLLEEYNGIRYYTPRISMDYRGALASISRADLKFTERVFLFFLKLILKLKGIKRLDLEKFKNWGRVEFGLFAMASVELPFPNEFQQQIGRCIENLHPDIIQSHMSLQAIAGGIAKNSGVKGHLFFQAMVEDEKEFFPPRSIARALWSRAEEETLQWLIDNSKVDMYLAASDFVRQNLQDRGVNKNQLKTLYSPVVVDSFKPVSKSEARSKLGIPQDKHVLLSVGRMLTRKRFLDVIRIMKQLPDVVYYIKQSVCTSDSVLPTALKRVQREIRKNKLENRVIINNEVIPYEQMRYVYSAADIAVFPYLYEPFGMCAAEAMAAKLPLIVYNSGYLPQFIQDNGFVVEPMDLEGLRDKIKLLIEDEQLAEEMGFKGLELVKKYDIGILGERLVNFYKEFL